MRINNVLEGKSKKNVIIKSLIWKTIIDIFKQEKNIDITKYLISVTISGKIIKLKTTKPIINTELLLINDKIKSEIEKKFKKLGINFFDFEIKYM